MLFTDCRDAELLRRERRCFADLATTLSDREENGCGRALLRWPQFFWHTKALSQAVEEGHSARRELVALNLEDAV